MSIIEAAPTRAVGKRTSRAPATLGVVLVLLGAGLFAAAAWRALAARGTSYSSEALVVVMAPKAQSAADGIPIAAVWAQAGRTDSLLGEAAVDEQVSLSDLAASTTVTAVDSAPLVSIKVSRGDAGTAARWANAVSAAMVSRAAVNPISGFTLQSLTRAVPATQASSSAGAPVILAAGLLGALAGLVAAQAYAHLPRRRRS